MTDEIGNSFTVESASITSRCAVPLRAGGCAAMQHMTTHTLQSLGSTHTHAKTHQQAHNTQTDGLTAAHTFHTHSALKLLVLTPFLHCHMHFMSLTRLLAPSHVLYTRSCSASQKSARGIMQEQKHDNTHILNKISLPQGSGSNAALKYTRPPPRPTSSSTSRIKQRQPYMP